MDANRQNVLRIIYDRQKQGLVAGVAVIARAVD